MGELRKESGSKAGGKDRGSRGGEGEEWEEGGEVAAAGAGEQMEEEVLEEEEWVRSRPPMTGEGRSVRESVATPGALTGDGGGGREGGAGEEEVGGEGEADLAAGGGRAGESSNCPDRVSDRLLPGPASSPIAPPPPAMAVVVAMTMRAFWGSATVVRLARRL